eukprot:TRINITY_DN672_c0_g1_i1.p1 TRINITY_DN672_c0_g1~~TRINITY_DN672_c0_g1_i1.p1  ORF type:complete len:807 (+),score=139.87 TRINITY_DN672_c0_g1_i1:60-2480(+)
MVDYVEYLVNGVHSVFDLNTSTLSGAIDVIVVPQPDGTFQCTPFHVRFGKVQMFRTKETVVNLIINDQASDLKMKLGAAGEAFFVHETEEPVDSFLASSPIPSPSSSPPISSNSSPTSSPRMSPKKNRPSTESTENLSNSLPDFPSLESLEHKKSISLVGSPSELRNIESEKKKEDLTLSQVSQNSSQLLALSLEGSVQKYVINAINKQTNWFWSWGWGGLPVWRKTKTKKEVSEVTNTSLSSKSIPTSPNPTQNNAKSWRLPSVFRMFKGKNPSVSSPVQQIKHEIDLEAKEDDKDKKNESEQGGGQEQEQEQEHEHGQGQEQDLTKNEGEIFHLELDDTPQDSNNKFGHFSDTPHSTTVSIETHNASEMETKFDKIGQTTNKIEADRGTADSDSDSDSSVHLQGTDSALTLITAPLSTSAPTTKSLRMRPNYLRESQTIIEARMREEEESFRKSELRSPDNSCSNSPPLDLSSITSISTTTTSTTTTSTTTTTTTTTSIINTTTLLPEQSIKSPPQERDASKSASPAGRGKGGWLSSWIWSKPTAARKPNFKKSLKPTSDQLKTMNLKAGENRIVFTAYSKLRGVQRVVAYIYLWDPDVKIIISDIDGTITRSDVFGQIMPMLGRDWSHIGVTKLYTSIADNGYHILYLTARAIGQYSQTRGYLTHLRQDEFQIPPGPIFTSPDGLLQSFNREIIRRQPQEFKIACLRDILSVFPNGSNPFYAGFGNRLTDAISYRTVGVPDGKIFTINHIGEISVTNLTHKNSYMNLHELVNEMFPSTKHLNEQFNDWNYWRLPIPDLADLVL